MPVEPPELLELRDAARNLLLGEHVMVLGETISGDTTRTGNSLKPSRITFSFSFLFFCGLCILSASRYGSPYCFRLGLAVDTAVINP